MEVTEQKIKEQVTTIAEEVIANGNVHKGDIFVLGCTTSEVVGGTIGKNSSVEVGQWIVSALKETLDSHGIFLAVQGCEHINRALAMERSVAQAKGFEIVSVVPQLHAGGSCSVAAFQLFEDPVEVEHITAQAGFDIGDTSIGMHVKHVQVPLRPSIKAIGAAHVTALYARPKYIGGPRAHYA
ncbi:TIGR01440 family protein [Enterococcus faecalis]